MRVLVARKAVTNAPKATPGTIYGALGPNVIIMTANA